MAHGKKNGSPIWVMPSSLIVNEGTKQAYDLLKKTSASLGQTFEYVLASTAFDNVTAIDAAKVLIKALEGEGKNMKDSFTLHYPVLNVEESLKQDKVVTTSESVAVFKASREELIAACKAYLAVGSRGEAEGKANKTYTYHYFGRINPLPNNGYTIGEAAKSDKKTRGKKEALDF